MTTDTSQPDDGTAPYVPFRVNDRPRVCWDPELQRKNLAFIRGVDSTYYEHVADVHSQHLDGDAKLQAAAALRIAHSQGLETLLALLCATMQAPDCVIGWMLSYRSTDLQAMVEAVSSGDQRNVLPIFRPATWQSMAALVHSGTHWPSDKDTEIQEGFGRLWSRLARDYADERNRQEYNALKHGTRPALGGFTFALGRQSAPNVPAPPEAMRSMGGSEFGSTFYVVEPLSDHRLHFQPKRVSRNWVPANLVYGLRLLAMSIGNVTSFLRIVNGDTPESCRFEAPTDEGGFDKPWAELCGVNSMTMDLSIRPDSVVVPRDQILAMLEARYLGPEPTPSS